MVFVLYKNTSLVGEDNKFSWGSGEICLTLFFGWTSSEKELFSSDSSSSAFLFNSSASPSSSTTSYPLSSKLGFCISLGGVYTGAYCASELLLFHISCGYCLLSTLLSRLRLLELSLLLQSHAMVRWGDLGWITMLLV